MLRFMLLTAALGWAPAAFAGGSNYGIVPGALPEVKGQVAEWPVPTPKFARDPAPGPEGDIYIAVMQGNRIARFDPRSETFNEWELPPGARPHGLLVDQAGIVWYTGNGNGTIGRLDPKSGKVTEYKTPSGGDPHTLVLDGEGRIWFTMQGAGRVGRLERESGRITEYAASGGPYGIAAAPDGMLWVTAYGSGQLLKVDPRTRQVVKAYPMPAGEDGGPYAVTVDAAGRVWANEINSDTVALLDPASGPAP